MKRLFMAILLLLNSIMPAWASDESGASSAKTPGLSGFYLGTAVGYGYSITTEVGTVNGIPTAISPWEMNPNGLTFGGFLGYHWQFPGTPFVIGLEGAVLGANMKDVVQVAPTQEQSHKINSTWEFRGKVGGFIKNIFIYAAGGYTGAVIETTYTCCGERWSSTKLFNGWTLGGGLEFSVTPHWKIRADYQYKEFRKKTTIDFAPQFPGILTHSDPSFNQVTFGIAYQF